MECVCVWEDGLIIIITGYNSVHVTQSTIIQKTITMTIIKKQALV